MKSRWKSQLKGALRTRVQLEAYFNHPFPELDYPILIPLSLAQRIKKQGVHSPLALQFLPNQQEAMPGGEVDPISDHQFSPTSQLVHRYSNRVLFFPTSTCPVICRYCFRKNELYSNDPLFSSRFDDVMNYLRSHPEVEEVIFSGGDPLMVSDQKIAQYLEAFSSLEHIRFIRWHTRFMTILPDRFNSKLLKTLSSYRHRFKKMSFVLHTNLREEWTPQMELKVQRLRERMIDIYSQTVLLKGVNDSSVTLYQLFAHLSSIGVNPYYLHHPDRAQGALHYGLSIEEGRKIYHQLKTKLSGWSLPRYVIETPNGGGKVDLFNSESFEFRGKFINSSGQQVAY